MSNIAVIPSAGSGSRFNSPIPKQYLKVLGKELIVYTLEVFQNCDLIDEIIIPADEKYFLLLNNLKEKYNISKISKIVRGGKERQNSVYNGITAKKFDTNDYIIVHDAARPLLSNNLLEIAIKRAYKYDNVVIDLKARDTLIKGEINVESYLERSMIYYAQTPQIFRYEILLDSFKKAERENYTATDESMLVKNAGYEVKIVEGEFINFKVTEKKDLIFLEKLLIKTSSSI
ncbi:MAG: 2-C-methyl-D-erythritol 4-phosphate cytidylyltransferase [Ignavibacteriales bacterium]|nr:2-C-methyl-D-erythritol 4-phosphate cytidylyltransferase [Ignavibacteriales bacterium]